MRALARHGKMRPFEMQPGKSGHLGPCRLNPRRDGRAWSLSRRVGDQRRQQRVVPNRRCAAQIVRIASTSGASFISTPPPPLTCRSTNPGASMPGQVGHRGVRVEWHSARRSPSTRPFSTHQRRAQVLTLRRRRCARRESNARSYRLRHLAQMARRVGSNPRGRASISTKP